MVLLLAILIVLLIYLIIIIEMLGKREKIREYGRYGIAVAVPILFLDVTYLWKLLGIFLHEALVIYLIAILSPMMFLKNFSVTTMGVFYSSELGLRGFSLFRTKLRKFLTYTLGALLISLAIAWLTVEILQPKPSGLLEDMMEEYQVEEMGSLPKSLIIPLIMAASISEEVSYRLGIQNFLASKLRLVSEREYQVAILLSSSLWAMSHAYNLDPWYSGLVYTFPMGIILGNLFRRFGIESCLIVHSLYNLIVVYVP